MKIGGCVTLDGLRTSLVLLGIGLLTAACGGGGDQMTGAPEQDAMPGNGGGSPVTQLGEWNVPMPGGLDLTRRKRFAESILRFIRRSRRGWRAGTT